MKRREFLLFLNKVVFYFEVMISALLVIGILISLPDIFKYYFQILINNVEISVALFKDFLSHILLLVIAMEFVLLMVAHTDATIIHLITLVIARKMLVVSDGMYDLLVGVISLTILYIVRKYLTHSTSKSELLFNSNNNKIFSAAAQISDLNDRYNFHINERNSNSIGGLVSLLFEEQGKEFEVGLMIDDGDYIYEIEKMNNGVIEEVSIHEIS